MSGILLKLYLLGATLCLEGKEREPSCLAGIWFLNGKNSMVESGNTKMDSLSATIRRQIGAERNQRYLRSLPQFRLSNDMPDAIGRLLAELDRAEARAQGGMNDN